MEVISDNDVESKCVDFSSSHHSRRNKRKMTEPRRRATTDFSIRSICSSSNSDVDVDDDDDDEQAVKAMTQHDHRRRTNPDSSKFVNPSAPIRIGVSSVDAEDSTFEHAEPHLFYPLNMPMVYSASHGIPRHHFNPFVTAASASSMSSGIRVTGVTDGFAIPTDSRNSLKCDIRRQSPLCQSPLADNDNIPSPTKDEDQRPVRHAGHGNTADEYADNDKHQILRLGVDDRSRRKKRRNGSGNRRSVSTATTMESSSVSPGARSDESPTRPYAIPNVNRQRTNVDVPISSRRGVSAGARSAKFGVDDATILNVEELESRASSPLRKNYKNMTKQRRIEANARERTRVHTISAAFESLRRAVPSYSYNQRLSKLAILRIACSYILALARLADLDYTVAASTSRDDGSDSSDSMTFAECVDLCTRTIQTEGKAKRRH